jgi:hypothetical protein
MLFILWFKLFVLSSLWLVGRSFWNMYMYTPVNREEILIVTIPFISVIALGIGYFTLFVW